MRDFSLSIYKSLLYHLKEAGFHFKTFSDYLQAPSDQTVMLRHDVDDRKHHSLEFAKIQQTLGIQGTYYFRVVPQSFDEGIIKEIHEMGHEVGYHYEDMDFAKGAPHKAIKLFEQHLNKLRNVVPISSICMHGSPRSKYDNKDLWKYYNYRDYGLIGEPFLDLNYKKVFYLTDTGRRWDGHKVSVRDKVDNHFGLSFHSTHEIIECVRSGQLPQKVMINFHPQRWTDDFLLWGKEKYGQRIKNMVKYWIIRSRNGKQIRTPVTPPKH